MSIILILFVLFLCIGGLPQISGQFHGGGYGLSGFGAILLLALVILLLTGRM